MKLVTNALYEECLAKVEPSLLKEVRLNVEIANRIVDILKRRGLSQRQFAQMLGKKEPEISRWLTGAKGFTTKTLARISEALGEDVISVTNDRKLSATDFETVPIVILANNFATINTEMQRHISSIQNQKYLKLA